VGERDWFPLNPRDLGYLAGSGFRLEHRGGSVERSPAMLGEHTDEVLGEAGYSPAEVAEMRETKVVWHSQQEKFADSAGFCYKNR